MRRRIVPRVSALHTRLLEERTASGLPVWEVSRIAHEHEAWLLSLNGIDTPRPTYGDVDVALSMSGPLMPQREIGQQMVLLLSAIGGVVFLALDLVGA